MQPRSFSDKLFRACWKRRFDSVHQARSAHRRAGFRIRVYVCGDCGHYHVANADKRSR